MNKHTRSLVRLLLTLSLCGTLATNSGCDRKAEGGGTTTGNPLTEDTSATGSVAGLVGAALSGSSSTGTYSFNRRSPAEKLFSLFLPEALAAGSCPTFATPAGATCSVSGSTMWLSYQACNYLGSTLTFSGTQAISLSSGSPNCGTFPSPPANGTLTTQFVSASGSTTPGAMSMTNSYGTTVYFDHATANLGNFDQVTIPPLANGGYGKSISFDSNGRRTSITIAQRNVALLRFNHSIYGNFTIANEQNGTRSASGSMQVYHNGLQVIGTTSFSGVTHSDSCCHPTAGTFTTAFTAGANVAPTELGQRLVGLSETLEITACGAGRLTNAEGEITSVRLTRCF